MRRAAQYAKSVGDIITSIASIGEFVDALDLEPMPSKRLRTVLEEMAAKALEAKTDSERQPIDLEAEKEQLLDEISRLDNILQNNYYPYGDMNGEESREDMANMEGQIHEARERLRALELQERRQKEEMGTHPPSDLREAEEKLKSAKAQANQTRGAEKAAADKATVASDCDHDWEADDPYGDYNAFGFVNWECRKCGVHPQHYGTDSP